MSSTLPYEWVSGHVGVPLPCNWVKLTDVPELNYYSKDSVGEICVKGPNCVKGTCIFDNFQFISFYFMIVIVITVLIVVQICIMIAKIMKISHNQN